MTGWDDRTFLEDLVARGVDDWIYAAEVYDIAARSGLKDPDQLRMLAVGLIAEALVRGFVVAGDYDGGNHRPWESSTGDAIVRVVESWARWGGEVPTPGSIVWLDLTPVGREIGEAVLAREQEAQAGP